MENIHQNDTQQEASGFGILKIIGGLIFSVVLIYSGVSRIFGDNILEKATHINLSKSAQWEDFKKKGGLDYKSSWHGYHVNRIRVYHDKKTGKLDVLEIILDKSTSNSKLASVDNLRNTLLSDCGSQWEKRAETRGISLWHSDDSRYNCRVIDLGSKVAITIFTNSAEQGTVETMIQTLLEDVLQGRIKI